MEKSRHAQDAAQPVWAAALMLAAFVVPLLGYGLIDRITWPFVLEMMVQRREPAVASPVVAPTLFWSQLAIIAASAGVGLVTLAGLRRLLGLPGASMTLYRISQAFAGINPLIAFCAVFL